MLVTGRVILNTKCKVDVSVMEIFKSFRSVRTLVGYYGFDYVLVRFFCVTHLRKVFLFSTAIDFR